MIHIRDLEDGAVVFDALGSATRRRILGVLQQTPELNLKEIAAKLQITSGAMTKHVQMLEDAGLVRTTGGTTRGKEKRCRLCADSIIVQIRPERTGEGEHACEAEVPVGHFVDYDVTPTCGLATTKGLVGEVDDPRYFASPERVEAGMVWFSTGYLEYRLPNLLPVDAAPEQLRLTMELGSEAPGSQDHWPSDISFSVNGVTLGTWTSPGDFGDVPGALNPDWWFRDWNQYGLMKTLVVNRQGSFLDGKKLSDADISALSIRYASPVRLRLSVSPEAKHPGGLTIYGQGFGNYPQGIQMRLDYGMRP